MSEHKQFCSKLRNEVLVIVLCSGFGAWLAYGLGKTVNFVIDGRLMHVEAACAVLGLIFGFTGARLLMPVVLPAKTKPDTQRPKPKS